MKTNVMKPINQIKLENYYSYKQTFDNNLRAMSKKWLVLIIFKKFKFIRFQTFRRQASSMCNKNILITVTVLCNFVRSKSDILVLNK